MEDNRSVLVRTLRRRATLPLGRLARPLDAPRTSWAGPASETQRVITIVWNDRPERELTMSVCELQPLNLFRGSLTAARRSLLQRLVDAGGSLAEAALSTRERSTAFRMTDAAAKLVEWNPPQNGGRDRIVVEWTLSITDAGRTAMRDIPQDLDSRHVAALRHLDLRTWRNWQNAPAPADAQAYEDLVVLKLVKVDAAGVLCRLTTHGAAAVEGFKMLGDMSIEEWRGSLD